MIVLDSGDAVRGDAAAAAVVDYTIYGLDDNTLKQLADGQLGAAEADLYLSDSVDVVTTIVMVNTDTVARAINLYVKPSAGTSRSIIAKDLSLGAGYSLHWSGDKITVMNTDGEIAMTVFSAVGTSGSPLANDIARFTDANTIEGRTYAEVKGDLNLEIGTDVLAQQTIGIANDNLLEVDQADAADNDFAKFTAVGLEGRSYTETKTDLGLVIGTDVLAEQTIGIADDNLLEVDGTPVDGEAAVFTAAGINSLSEAEFKSAFNMEAGTDYQGLLTNSAGLLAALDDETGTGLAVFGTAPTLTAATLAGTLSCADNLVNRPKFTDYGETVNAIGDTGGGSDAIDISLGNVVTATVSTAEQTFTFTNPSASGTACSFTLILTNGGSQTVNWPAAVDWAGGTAPTLTTAGVDVLTFTTVDAGTIWYGFATGLDMQ
jgi:hypothetical protein